MLMFGWAILSIIGVMGLLFVFAGLGKMMQLKPASGLVRLVVGATCCLAGGAIALGSLNLLTYTPRADNSPIVTIAFGEETDGILSAELVYPDGTSDQIEVHGNEWDLSARLITFRPFSSWLGYNEVYRIDRLYGRFGGIDRTSETSGIRLSEDPGLSLFDLAIAQGDRFGVSEKMLGLATYAAITPGLKYEVSIGEMGLIARPLNPLPSTEEETD